MLRSVRWGFLLEKQQLCIWFLEKIFLNLIPKIRDKRAKAVEAVAAQHPVVYS
ncbi:Protein of unknown function, partial [Cotesia congregata]